MQFLLREIKGEKLRSFKEVCQPYYLSTGARILRIAGIDLASIDYDAQLASPGAIVVEGILEQGRRLRSLRQLAHERHVQMLASRSAAGVVHHGIIRRAFDYLSTIDSDPMECRVTRGDKRLLGQLGVPMVGQAD